MTMVSLDYVLKKSLGRHPHCFRAWEQGRGYVNDGSDPRKREEFYRQYRKAAQAEIDNMLFAPDYAEPGYETPEKAILFANWNYLARGLDRILERMGFAVEWSDEWATCDECNKAVRTEPDSYFWEPFYVIENDCEVICKTCHEERKENS